MGGSRSEQEPKHPQGQARLIADLTPAPPPTHRLNSVFSSPHLQPRLRQLHLQPRVHQLHLQPHLRQLHLQPLPLLPVFPTPTPSPSPGRSLPDPGQILPSLAEVGEKVRSQAQSTVQGRRVPLESVPLMRSPPTTRGQRNITEGC